MFTRVVNKQQFLVFCAINFTDYERTKPCVVEDLGENLRVNFLHPAAPKSVFSRRKFDGLDFAAILAGETSLELILERARVQNFFEKPRHGHVHAHGPGTELKKMLRGWPFYFDFPSNCSCNKRVAELDRWGTQGCETRVTEIVEELKTEAANRGYDRAIAFLESAGTLLVRRIIRRAQRNLYNFDLCLSCTFGMAQ